MYRTRDTETLLKIAGLNAITLSRKRCGHSVVYTPERIRNPLAKRLACGPRPALGNQLESTTFGFSPDSLQMFCYCMLCTIYNRYVTFHKMKTF